MTLSRVAAIRLVVKPLLLAAALAPMALLVAGLAGWWGVSLGANPVEKILETLGKTSLNLVLITLCVSPLRQLTGWSELMRVRRMLGLAAFAYVLTHFLFYVLVDQGLDFNILLEDVAKRPFITAGFTGFLLLIPLAVTSTRASMRRLGRRWGQLHRLVYVTALLGCVHYYWQVKADVREPLLYFAALAVLLGWRLYRHLQHRARPVAAG